MSTSRNIPFDFDVSAYELLPRLRGLFVTGTDTGVGKTLVAGAIARSLRRRGRRVEVFKPVASGCRRTREGLVSADAEFLAACAESRRTLSEITPVRYAAPAAPNVAAEREHRGVDLDAIFREYRRLENACEAVIVEGVGGLLCPLSDDFWVIHLAKMMNLPVVIVARAALGTINHTLLTLHAARSAGLNVAGVIINGYAVDPKSSGTAGMSVEAPEKIENKAENKGDNTQFPQKDAEIGCRPRQSAPGAGGTVFVPPLEPSGSQTPRPRPPAEDNPHEDIDISMQTNPVQIANRGKVNILAIVPDEPGNSVEQATIGLDTQFSIDQARWDEILGLE